MTQRKQSIFRGNVSDDAREQREAKSTYGYLRLPKGTQVFTIEEDTKKITIDILPYEVTDEKHPNRKDEKGRAIPGSLWYKRPFWIHRSIGAENENVICLKTIGAKCPICEYQKKRFNEGADKEELSALRAKMRNLYAIVPVNMKGYDETVYVWDMSQALFQDVLQDILEEDPSNEIFPDLEEGKTLEIALKWSKLGKNVFPEVRNIEFNDRQPYEESVLDDVPKLDEMLHIMTYKELEALFFEQDPEVDSIEEIDHGKEAVRSRTREIEHHERSKQREEPAVEHRKGPIPEPKKTLGRGKSEGEMQQSERSSLRRGSPKQETEEETKCPSGYKFGKDTDKYPECRRCEVWDPCDEAKSNG